MDIEKIVRDLKEVDYTYSEISRYLWDTYNIALSEDQLRYMNKRKYVNLERKNDVYEKIEKVLVLSDLHIPFQIDVLPIVKKHKNEISAMVINGDAMDCAEISKFAGLGKCPLDKEKILTYQFFKQVDDETPGMDKYLVKGNHEFRWEVYLAKEGGVHTNFCSNNILEEVINGFTYYDHETNTSIVYPPLKNYIIVDKWYFQYKDVIFCHPKSFSTIEGRTAMMALDYFEKQGYDFKACFVGHTHKQASGWKYGKFGCETGCLCVDQDYADTGRLNMTPCQKGYALVAFKNDEYSHNDSKVIVIDG